MSTKVRPAQMRTKLTFYTMVRTPDAQGGSITTQSPGIDLWGHLTAASGREQWLSQQLQTEVEFSFQCRQVAEVVAKMHAKDQGGRVLEVLAISKGDDDPRWMKVALRQYQERSEDGGTAA